MICLHCYTAEMTVPENQHPAYVECLNCGAIELIYIPQDYQKSAHNIPYQKNKDGSLKIQIVGFFGGFGSGKSKASLQEVFMRALENPRGTGLLTAPTLQQLKRTTLKTFFNEVCPPPLIQRYNKSDGEIELKNGFVFYTIPSDDEEKLRSINAGIIHMEEASGIKLSIYEQLLNRMRDFNVKNKMFAVCSNPDMGWIKDVFVDNEKRKDLNHPEHNLYNPYINALVWETALNKHLPPDFIEVNSRGKPDWWIQRYLKGSFEHSDGMVYPNISKTFVDPFNIPSHWEKFVTLDHGLRNPTAVLFGTIDKDKGIVYIYDEYYKANTLVPEHAKELKPKIEKIPHGRLRFMVGDPSIRNKTDPINGKSVQALYQEYGLFFTEGNNNIEAGILRVNSYIERGRLKIFNNCINLRKEIINYKFPELKTDNYNKNLDEKPVKANDHACDSLRYGMMRLPEDPDMLANDSYNPPKRVTQDEPEYEYEDFSGRGFLSFV